MMVWMFPVLTGGGWSRKLACVWCCLGKRMHRPGKRLFRISCERIKGICNVSNFIGTNADR